MSWENASAGVLKSRHFRGVLLRRQTILASSASEMELRSVLRGNGPQTSDGVFDAALLPGAVRIAEESFDIDGSVQPVMLGKFGSIVEADGST